jgi:hypothetical protein
LSKYGARNQPPFAPLRNKTMHLRTLMKSPMLAPHLKIMVSN